MTRVPNLAWLAAACLGACVQADAPAVDLGTVIAVRPADVPGENSGAGGVAGAIGGGIIGSQFGSSGGAIAATIVGIVAGSVAGTAAETSLQNSSGLEYTVKLDRGYVVTVDQHREAGDVVLAPGSRVRFETNGRHQRVLPLDQAAAN
jgi:outer membrane lipoprotein SlyB